MVAFTYRQYGDYIGSQSPYAQPGDAVLAPGYNAPNTTVTTIRTNANYVWDFRHAFPWDQEPGNPSRPLKVQNYQVVKAMLIPYSYTRKLDSANGGSTTTGAAAAAPFAAQTQIGITINAHLLVGYSFKDALPAHALAAQVAATDNGYQGLGLFLRDQTPGATATNSPRLLAQLPTGGPRTTDLEIAQSWLANVSAARALLDGFPLKSTSDSEMELFQEQQCFNWDFEVAVPAAAGGAAPFGATFGAAAGPVAHPAPNFPVPPLAGATWLRNFQISKAIRALFEVDILNNPANPGAGILKTVQGELLVGFSGGGGM